MIEIQIKAGKKYNLSFPNHMEPVKCHIDYILKNKYHSDNTDSKLVVFRWWAFTRKRFVYEIYPYWLIAMYNDWDYTGKRKRNKTEKP